MSKSRALLQSRAATALSPTPACAVLCYAVLCAGSLVRAVLLATADADDTAEPQHWEDGPRTAAPTDTVEEWDVINLSGDGEWLARVRRAACTAQYSIKEAPR